ncbi:MAG: DUF1349 domain-containing protein [Myxococcota bacterium]|nr:DUF1349 domain-containing protein [Myxococcota bacterium]
MKIHSIGQAIDRSNDFTQVEEVESVGFRLAAGPCTDWFTDPNGAYRTASAPILWFEGPKGDFVFGATVHVRLVSSFDAAGIVMRCGTDWWAKLAYELSPRGAPTIVSVVSSPVSDDANGPEPAADSVQLRLMKKTDAVAMHWRVSAEPWSLSRYAALPSSAPVEVGLTVQSPTGEGIGALFSGCFMEESVPEDIRSGS